MISFAWVLKKLSFECIPQERSPKQPLPYEKIMLKNIFSFFRSSTASCTVICARRVEIL